MKLESFYSALHERKFAPVYLFWGEEDFLIDEAIESLTNEVLRDGNRDFNLDVLYGDDVDPREVIAHASSFPTMTERRVVILKDFDQLSEKKLVSTYVENPCESTILVLVSRKTDHSLHGKVTEVQFPRRREYELAQWISERAARHGKDVSPEACELLNVYVGNSLRALASEIEKLVIHVGEKKAIDLDDVRAIVGVSRTYNAFELTTAVGNRDLPRAIEILKRMMDIGESLPFIVAMLTKRFMDLLKLADGRKRKMSQRELAAIVPSNRLRECLSQLRNFSTEALERSFASLVKADEKLKFTSEDPHSVMIVLLHELLE